MARERVKKERTAQLVARLPAQDGRVVGVGDASVRVDARDDLRDVVLRASTREERELLGKVESGDEDEGTHGIGGDDGPVRVEGCTAVGERAAAELEEVVPAHEQVVSEEVAKGGSSGEERTHLPPCCGERRRQGQ